VSYTVGMRRSLTDLRTDFRDFTSDDDIANANIDRLINRGISAIRANLTRYPSRVERTINTVSGQAEYPMPIGVNRITTMTVTVGSAKYPVLPIDNPRLWNRIVSFTGNSETARYFHANDTSFDLYPTPSGNNLLTLQCELADKLLSNADYTTGNVLRIENGKTKVLGEGTVWTNAMAGRYLRIDSDTNWYKITSITGPQELELIQGYEGETVDINDAVEAYAIGEQANLPEDLHETIVHWASMRYFQIVKRSNQKYREHRAEFKEQMKDAMGRYSTRSTSRVSSPKRIGASFVNPNDFPTIVV